MTDAPELSELGALYSSLTPEERDELLQCLLVAAPRGGEAMLKTLEDYLLCVASEEFVDGLPRGRGMGAKGDDEK